MSNLKINLERVNTHNIMAAKMWIEEGSRADPKSLKGIHQILSSTMCRGCGPYDNNQFAGLVENSGAILRCEAYEDGLLISLKCINNDAFKLTSLLGWMITEPRLEENQIQLEKDLTLKALIRQSENSFQKAFDGWRQLAYNKGPYGHDPIGTKSDINKITKDKVLEISNTLLYRKKNLVISGSYPKDISNYIKDSNAFEKLLISKSMYERNTTQSKSINDKHKNIDTFCTKYENTQQVVIIMGKPTVSYSNKSDLPIRLIGCYLGYGMSSLLFRVLREKYGVVYEVGVYHPIREKESPFIVHASTTEEKALITIKLLKQCWQEIIETEVKSDELRLIKKKFLGQIAHSVQSISQQAERKAHLLGIGLNINHDKEIVARLETITSQDLLKAARIYLKTPILSVCGNRKIVNKIEKEWIKS